MKVYRGIEHFEKLEKAVVTSGTFDGVHYGHRKILQGVRQRAQKSGAETVLLTFWPHPRLVLFPGQIDLQLLSTIDEKIELIRGQGIDHMLILEFTKEFSEMSSEHFIRNILVDTIGTGELVIGYDHKFGRNREGSFENLRKDAPAHGFTVEEIPRQEIDDIAISSTKIRKALLQGQVALANEFLCTPYSLCGKVVRGEQVGRELGYPTANIEVPELYKLIPAGGVYAVKARLGGSLLKGMMNIGHRPTFSGHERSVEVNLFDFDRDIYGEHLTVSIERRLRDEHKFENADELKRQLGQDEQMARKALE